MIFRKFIHPSTAQVLRVASIFLTVANTILALGSTLTGLPASFAWLSTLWPTLYGVAFILHQLASTFGITPDPTLAAQLAQAQLDAAKVAGIVEGAKESLKQEKA